MAFALSAIDKVAFSIGSLDVRWYGLILVSGMIAGLIYICIECKRINLTSDDAVELFLWLVPLAIVFARIFYVIVRPDEYFPWHSWDDFVHAIAIWDGGITIIGGVFGGFIGLLIFAHLKRKKASFGQVVDLVVPALLIGQIIGRLGNFVNQEAFGIRITNPKLQSFPFAVYIDRPSGIEASLEHLYTGEGWYAATCFYEMAWNLVGLGIAIAIWKKNKKYAGVLMFFYIFWYSLGRGMLEYLRLDAVPITKTMCFVLVPIMFVLGLLFILERKSVFSFRRVFALIQNNESEIEVTKFEKSNFETLNKAFSNPKNPLRYLYAVKNYESVDVENLEYKIISSKEMNKKIKIEEEKIKKDLANKKEIEKFNSSENDKNFDKSESNKQKSHSQKLKDFASKLANYKNNKDNNDVSNDKK